MPRINNNRSEQFNEVISNNPGFLVRNGIAIFLLLLIAIFGICSFVKYPDIITTKATLTAINPPKEIKAKLAGRLINLMVKENDTVKQGAILGCIESNAKYNQVIELSILVDNCLTLSNNKDVNRIVKLLSNTNEKNSEVYGELQTANQTFKQSFQTYIQYLKQGFYLQKLAMLKKDVDYLINLQEQLLTQKTMTEEDIMLMQKNFEAQETLYNEKVIASVEYRNEKSKLISKELQIPQLTSSILNNENSQLAKQKEIAELQNQIELQHNIFIQALQTFKAQIDDWKMKYLLIAPIAGKVSFSSFIQQNQILQANQTLFFINPQSSSYYATTAIPQFNFGKIKLNQSVLLKFDSYPFMQYGYVNGTLTFISNIPSDSGYISKINLTNGLETNYKKPIIFREGLKATAEIITDDMSLLERFFYKIKASIKAS